MNVKKFLAIVTIIGIISFPIVVDKLISKTIVNEKNTLLTYGLELNVKKEFGFFGSKRDIELTIIDAEIFFKTLLIKLDIKIFEKKQLANFFSTSKIDDVLKGMKFKGNIITNNYLPNDYEINLALKKLSTKIMSVVSVEKDLEFIIDLLEEEIVEFKIILNANNEDDYTIILKDIKKEVNIKGEKIFFEFADNKLVKENNIHTYTINKQIFKTNNKTNNKANISLSMNNFKETYSYDDEFNQFLDISLNDYELLTKTLNLKALKFFMKIKTSSKNKIVNNDFLLNINHFFLRDKLLITSFDKLGFYLNFYNIKEKEIKNLLDSIQNPNNYNISSSENKLFLALLDIVNLGFDTKLTLNLKNLNFSGQLLNNLDLQIDVKLNKNRITNSSLPPEILENLDITSKIILDEKFLQNPLIKMSLGKILSYGKVKGTSVIFDIKYKDLVLRVNDNKVKL